MKRERQQHIIELCKEMQIQESNTSMLDCFFALHGQRIITIQEFDYLLNWMDI